MLAAAIVNELLLKDPMTAAYESALERSALCPG